MRFYATLAENVEGRFLHISRRPSARWSLDERATAGRRVRQAALPVQSSVRGRGYAFRGPVMAQQVCYNFHFRRFFVVQGCDPVMERRLTPTDTP
jgi:hypothetical protein